jgi:hypothetical protein
MRVPLVPHPTSRCDAVRSIDVEVTRPGPRRLALTYHLAGDFRQIVWPLRAPAGRRAGLWRHTCMEAFVRSEGGEGYFEFNLSPSTEWAAWRFTGRRQGMTEERRVADPRVDSRCAEGSGLLAATLDLERVSSLRADVPMLLALSAVIEERGGRLSYWALTHPSDEPDFHHPDGFCLPLQPASQS